MNNSTEQFKRAFFDLPSRAFGETYVQKLLYKILGEKKFTGTDKIKSNLLDAQRGNLKGEYKAVRVVFENKSGDCLYENVINSTPMSTRIASIQDIRDGKTVANFQNIKLHDGDKFEFDYLIYVLVDDYGFYIFEISGTDMTKAVKNNEFPNWCDKHGSKETGKNGQFTIRKENLDWHLNHLKRTVCWNDLAKYAKSIE